MNADARRVFRIAAGFLAANAPHGFTVQQDVNAMDDTTLFVVVALGLLILYVNDDPTIAIDATIGTDNPAPGPQPPAPPQLPAPGPVATPGPVAQPPTSLGGDDVDLSQYTIVGGSPDVRSWPVTVPLTMAGVEPAITPSFPLPDSWPDVIPPGFEGPIAYTVWAFVPALRVGAGFIEMWRGRENCGNNDAGTAALQLARNWWYYVPELAGYVPAPGEQIGFMVTPGDARDGKGPFPVAERSNVVLVTMP